MGVYGAIIIIIITIDAALNSQVILTADIPVLDNRGGIIFTSTDAGATFKFIQLPFHLAQPIVYHFQNPDYLVALSIDVSLTLSRELKHTPSTKLKVKVNISVPSWQGGLWLSLDFGAKWTKVHDGVHAFSW